MADASDLTAHSHDQVVRVASGEPEPHARRPARPPRIEEVARKAGVSPITVSRALRAPHVVSSATRERILKVVEQTGYWSNPHAVALRSGRSTIVAAFVSNLLSPQYSRATRACAQVIEQHGYQLMIGQTSYSYARELSAIQSLRALRPAAVFITGVIELEENRALLRELDIPIVESWAYPRDPLDMLVGCSNTDAGRLAASHLAERGYRKLAYIGRSGGRGALRFSGFSERARHLGVEIVDSILVDQMDSVLDGRRAYAALVERGGAFDAVFCANDLLAVGALLEARQCGRRIPDDVAILAFGDNDLASELTPRLSMISFDSQALGARAGQLIVDRLGSNVGQAHSECIDLQLHHREST